MQFNVGDVVQLKSGGPLMTVSYADSNKVLCLWFNRSGEAFETKQTELKPAMLNSGNLSHGQDV